MLCLHVSCEIMLLSFALAREPPTGLTPRTDKVGLARRGRLYSCPLLQGGKGALSQIVLRGGLGSLLNQIVLGTGMCCSIGGAA